MDSCTHLHKHTVLIRYSLSFHLAHHGLEQYARHAPVDVVWAKRLVTPTQLPEPDQHDCGATCSAGRNCGVRLFALSANPDMFVAAPYDVALLDRRVSSTMRAAGLLSTGQSTCIE